MRADRLLSLLMLLQARGRMSARELAAELEVSERTIYRDVEALSAAGVPLYGQAGPEGGYALLDSYRTNLTGLTEGEVRALSMLSIPEALGALGMGQELRTALLKLSAALPEARRRDEESVRQRFYMDSTWWAQGEEPVPHLRTIYDAVRQDRRLHLIYLILPLGIRVEQDVDPYGLVAKAGVWYLVCVVNEVFRVHRVSALLDVRPVAASFTRPEAFDLETFWKGWCAARERGYAAYPVTVRVVPEFLPELPRYFGAQIRTKLAEAGPPDAEGRVTLELAFESLETARERLLGLGRAVEVLEPLPLRRSLADFAEQIVALYKG